MEGKHGVPLRFSRPVLVLIATGIAAVSIGLPAAPASADQVRNSEYWLNTLNVTSAWSGSQGWGVTVALLSDGVSGSHPDLIWSVTRAPAPAGAPTASGQYFGEQGTAIASLIAGHGHGPGRADGIIGVAPRARILSIPVTLPADDPGLGGTAGAAQIPAAIAAGIRYAVDHGATVIDLPIDPSQPGVAGTGGTAAAAGGSAAEQSAVAYALRHDVVLVAPAGDNGAATDAPNYPAAYQGVIAVGAFGGAFYKAAWSSHQHYVTITAAGAGVIAASGSGYQTMNSTNAASAVVSGVVALIRARYPELTVAQVREALISSTMYRRPGGLADGSGYGAVNADNALIAAGRLATAAAHRSGAGALPWQLPSGSLASSGTQSVGSQILRAGKIPAGALVLLLLLIGGYVAAGRLRRRSQPVIAVAPEWTNRQAQSSYPNASAADADPTLDVFSSATANTQRGTSELVRASQPDTGLFARAARLQLSQGTAGAGPVPAAGGPGAGLVGPVRAGGARLAGAAGSGAADAPGPTGRGGPAGRGSPVGGGDAARSAAAGWLARLAEQAGPDELAGPPTHAINRRPSVSGTPPWEAASPPYSDLPWTAAPGGHPGASPAGAPGAMTEQPWLAAPAEQLLRPSGGPLPRRGQPSGAGVTGAGSGEAKPGWTPKHGRPDPAEPAASPEPAWPRTAASGLPVRQPGANVPRPLSPSGSLWEPLETKSADEGDDDQDPGGRPIYVWNPH